MAEAGSPQTVEFGAVTCSYLTGGLRISAGPADPTAHVFEAEMRVIY